MNKPTRLSFTEQRPDTNDVIMLCTKDGKIWCGVVDCAENQIVMSMFVNDRETEGCVDFDDIRWWQPLPLTKKELYSGNAQI
jgi:hypothetical protein